MNLVTYLYRRFRTHALCCLLSHLPLLSPGRQRRCCHPLLSPTTKPPSLRLPLLPLQQHCYSHSAATATALLQPLVAAVQGRDGVGSCYSLQQELPEGGHVHGQRHVGVGGQRALAPHITHLQVRHRVMACVCVWWGGGGGGWWEVPCMFG